MKKNENEHNKKNQINCDPAVENNLLNLLRNREDFKKWLLATSDYGNEIQEDLNAIVGYDEKFNNAIVRHSLDLKDQIIFHNPNPMLPFMI